MVSGIVRGIRKRRRNVTRIKTAEEAVGRKESASGMLRQRSACRVSVLTLLQRRRLLVRQCSAVVRNRRARGVSRCYCRPVRVRPCQTVLLALRTVTVRACDAATDGMDGTGVIRVMVGTGVILLTVATCETDAICGTFGTGVTFAIRRWCADCVSTVSCAI